MRNAFWRVLLFLLEIFCISNVLFSNVNMMLNETLPHPMSHVQYFLHLREYRYLWFARFSRDRVEPIGKSSCTENCIQMHIVPQALIYTMIQMTTMQCLMIKLRIFSKTNGSTESTSCFRIRHGRKPSWASTPL